MHVGLQVCELHKQACSIAMYGRKLYFRGFPKSEMFTIIFICLFLAHHQTLTS